MNPRYEMAKTNPKEQPPQLNWLLVQETLEHGFLYPSGLYTEVGWARLLLHKR